MSSADLFDTWPKVLSQNYRTYGDRRVAMRVKYRGVWRALTWKDYYLEVRGLAFGLLALGFALRERLLIIGDNAPTWYAGELAAQSIRGVAMGVHPDVTPAEIKAIVQRFGVAFALVEGQEQVDKLLELKPELRSLRKIVFWNYKGLSHYSDPILIGCRELQELGASYAREHSDQFDAHVMCGQADEVCAIDAAGIALTYAAMSDRAREYLQSCPWLAKDTVLPYRPPVGAAEQHLGIACHLLSACTLGCTESPETHRRDARDLAPSLAYQPARVWESQAALVQARIMEADALKRLVYRVFKPVGDRMAECRACAREPSLGQRALYAVANLALFHPIRASLGLARVRLGYSYGTTLSHEATRFYGALNLPMQDLSRAEKEADV